MARHLTRLLRFLRLDASEAQSARSVLGEDHPLARAIARQHAIATQLLIVGIPVLLGAVGVLRHNDHAAAVLGSSLLVGLALTVAMTAARQFTCDHARALIAEGRGGVLLPVVRRERRRLAARTTREGLARTLERLLRDAQRWYEFLPQSRPVPEIRELRHVAPEVVAVVAGLRAEHPRVQGVALTSRFLFDASESPLYTGDAGQLREELNRIRYLLDAPRPTSAEGNPTLAAA